MGAITTSVDVGLPGVVVETNSSVIESGIYDVTKVPAAYGLPVKLVAGLVTKIEAGDAASDFYGILAKGEPANTGDANFISFGSPPPRPEDIPSVMIGGPGYIAVKATIGTPVKGAAVYMRVVESLPALVGDLEATADGGNNVLLTGVVWNSNGKDSNDSAIVRITSFS